MDCEHNEMIHRIDLVKYIHYLECTKCEKIFDIAHDQLEWVIKNTTDGILRRNTPPADS